MKGEEKEGKSGCMLADGKAPFLVCHLLGASSRCPTYIRNVDGKLYCHLLLFYCLVSHLIL